MKCLKCKFQAIGTIIGSVHSGVGRVSFGLCLEHMDKATEIAEDSLTGLIKYLYEEIPSLKEESLAKVRDKSAHRHTLKGEDKID